MKENKGGVTASSHAAAEAGVVILRAGGNAVDAAVATALASCVADPCNTGLGGFGGHMVIAPQGKEAICINFAPWMPTAFEKERTAKQSKSGPGASVVPNVIAGLARALKEYGSKSWGEVSAPAIGFARNGVELNSTLRRAFSQVEGLPFVTECFSFDDGQSNDSQSARIMCQQNLAETLEQLAAHGPHWLYEGPIGDSACKVFQDHGYPVSRAEWAEAPQSIAVFAAPHLEIGRQHFYSAPLQTSGSPVLFAIVSAALKLAKKNLELPSTMAMWAQAMASIWSYRLGAERGGDFDSASIADWVEQALAYRERPALSSDIGHTCHLNTCDGSGSLVAATLTHGPFWFGGRWAVPGTGIIMNSGMPLFASTPTIELQGRVYGVTNMAPTVVRSQNGTAIAIGCPGARRIPSIIGLALGKHLFGGLPIQRAVSEMRFHAETPIRVSVETNRANSELSDAFHNEFPQVENEDADSYYGPLTAIRRDTAGHIEFGLDDRWKGTGLLA